MEGETAVISVPNADQKSNPSSPGSANYQQHHRRSPADAARRNSSSSSAVRARTAEERHTLPEIPRNSLTASVAHVVARELGENFLKTPIRPETVKKLVVSGNVDDVSHRLYVQNLREIQAKRELQLQKIGHDERTFLLADIQAREEEEDAYLTSLYVDEQALTRDQVILPRDFLNYNLQRHIKLQADDEEIKQEAIEEISKQVPVEDKKLPKLARPTKKKTSDALWKDQMNVPERDWNRTRLRMIDKLTNYQINPRFDEIRQNQLITSMPTNKPPSLLPVFEAIPSEIVFTRYRVGEVHETTLILRNLSSVAHSCRVIPPKTVYFCISLSQYPSGQALVATGLSVVYNIKFAPDNLGIFEDQILVQCSNGTEFAVKLLAKRPPPLLTLPPLIDCGYWLIGGRKVCQFKVRNEGGEGRFALVPAASWPAMNFKSVVRTEIIQLPPFELAPSTLDLRSGDTFPLQVSFTPQLPGEFLEEFVMICDNGEITRYKLKGVAETIQVRFEDIEGGVIDLNDLEVRDISAQYSINFISINPFSYCQKKMTIKNMTHVELPFVWALLEPVLYTRDDFARQTQPIEIERNVCETSPFHVEPNRGTFPPLTTVEFRLIFAPSQIGNFHTVFHLIIPNAPVHPTQAPQSANLTSSTAPERAHSPDMIARSSVKSSGPIPSASNRIEDLTVLRLETRAMCENFKYIFDPFAVMFMDKLYKGLAYRKDFQLTNTSVSPLMVSWANMMGSQIVHVEPVVAEIPADATCQFTVILTGTEIGPAKIELPFKLDGIDDYGYLHVEADIIGPNVEVEPTTLDFGLVEFGETMEQFISIKNLSPIVAKCRVEEFNKDPDKPSSSLLAFPIGTDLILKPIEIYQLPLRLSAKEEGALLNHLQITIEDGKTMSIEVTAIIQRPSAYISPVELNIGETFLGVPTIQYIELHAVNGLPTRFQWGESIGTDHSQCSIEINPRSGTIYNGETCLIEIVFIAQQCGLLTDDWHIPCYIQNASQPIFLKINANMKGMNVEFRHEKNTFELDDQFTLDFDRVPLGQQSRLELLVTNLTDMQSSVRPQMARFKTREVTAVNGKKMQGFEPTDQEIGIGFHLEKPDSTVYPLAPRSTVAIPLSVISSMWGSYNDILQLQIDGIDFIKEIPVRVQITGNPIKMYLSSNKNDVSSPLPIVQFGMILHNSLPITKKVHMQNVSHIPIRIDWLVYDASDETVDKPKLIELIPVIDNNPFDEFDSNLIDDRDELVSATTSSTKVSSEAKSSTSGVTSASTVNSKPQPLVKLYAKPYRGERSVGKNGIYSVSPVSKIIKPREHCYLDITINPRHCPIKDRPIQCNARAVGVLSVSKERQGSSKQGFERAIFYEHEEQIEFEMHASLDMPSLRVEFDDDDNEVEQTEALSFAIPIGDIVSCQPNLYQCTLPPAMTPTLTPSKSSSGSTRTRREKIYTRSFNVLNTRQCSMPFELAISDSTFLSVEPSTSITLIPHSKARIQCHFHLSQSIINRFLATNLNNDPTLASQVEQSTTIEHGRRVRWREKLKIQFNQNEAEQIVPIDIRLYYPVLTVNCDRIDFGTCFLEQTRQRELTLKNLTCSSSAWSIRKVHTNIPDAFDAFRIEPKSGILTTELTSKQKPVQQIISIFFTAHHNHTYECHLLIEGLLGEPPISIILTGQGSYDGKYEAILDI